MTIDTCHIHQYTELDSDGECPTCNALGSSPCSPEFVCDECGEEYMGEPYDKNGCKLCYHCKDAQLFTRTMKLTEDQEQEIWGNVYSVAVVDDIDRKEFFHRLMATIAKGEGKVATLPLKWRVRAKSCDPSAKDAFMWAADELEKANAEARAQADECPFCAFCASAVILDSFKDELSLKEFHISGLCQKCQDSIARLQKAQV